MYIFFALLGYASAGIFKVVGKGLVFPLKRTPSNAVCAILLISAWLFALTEGGKLAWSDRDPADVESSNGIAYHKRDPVTGEYYPVTFEELGLEPPQH